jgi:Ser/Thr protein kinase RdoA (MazF antagonist)
MSAQVEFTEASARQAMEAGCRTVGLSGSASAELLRLGENALFALPGAGVVVRVARSSEMGEKVSKELAVARWLAEAGYPAVRLADLPQPVETHDRLVTFWEYVPDSSPASDPSVLAGLLRRFHALERPDFPIPRLDPFPVMRRRLGTIAGIAAADVQFLAEACDQAEEDFSEVVTASPPTVVHGDAHLGNVLVDATGRALLIDFEAVALGPQGWDLVPTAISKDRFGLSPEGYADFVTAYGSDVTRSHDYQVLRTTRELGMTTWLMQLAQSGSAAEEFAVRMESLRKGDLERRWHAL